MSPPFDKWDHRVVAHRLAPLVEGLPETILVAEGGGGAFEFFHLQGDAKGTIR